jgi:hypothetical protein
MPEDTYYMLGYDEQVVAVVPSRDLVIVRLGITREEGAWDHSGFNAHKLGNPDNYSFGRALSPSSGSSAAWCLCYLMPEQTRAAGS